MLDAKDTQQNAANCSASGHEPPEDKQSSKDVGKAPARIRCATPIFQASVLKDAHQAYLKKFGGPAPTYLSGYFTDRPLYRAEIIQRAVDSGTPLCESPSGQRLIALESEYANRFGVQPRTGFLWFGTDEDTVQERIAIIEECLSSGRRRLAVEFGKGDVISWESLPEDCSHGLLKQMWLDDSGNPILPNASDQ